MDKRMKWSLQMFGEGGESASAPAVGEGQTGENPIQQGEAPERLSFDDLLKNDAEYKKAFDNRVKSAVNRRFKAVDQERAALSPMYEALGRKYGLDVSDPAKIDLHALSDAVMADDELFEREAAEMGVTVEGLRKIRSAERQMGEANRLREEAEAQRAWQDVLAEGERLKAIYPGFDLEAELQNPQFGKLLANLQAGGFSDALRIAYESAHHDEIMSGALRYAVQQTKQQVSNSIQSGQKRPAENGAAAPASTSLDPRTLSRKQREDIHRRVMAGERITFK